jgi:hypothetical protein
MRKFFSTNLQLKIVSLGLAIVTWLYVNGELLTALLGTPIK